MSIWDFCKVCVASEVNIAITLHGEPVRHALVRRSAEWHRVGDIVDYALTDEHGGLFMPALYMDSIGQNLMLVEFVANIVITVEVEDREYEILNAIKRGPEENEEFGLLPRQLCCELTAERRVERFDSIGTLETTCVWE